MQRLLKNNTRWIKLYDQLLGGLKEAGDLVNFSEVIEKDLANINAAIEARRT